MPNKGFKHSEKTKKQMSELNKGNKNPNYGKKHTLETIEKISKTHLGKIPWNKGKPMSEEAKKKLSLARIGKYRGKDSPNYGKHLSEETKLKISRGNKGKLKGIKLPPFTEEHKKNLSNALKGKTAWNKGLHWPEEIKPKLARYGADHWNYGKTIPPETIKKMSEARKKNNPMKNPEISKKVAGENNGMYGIRGAEHPGWKGGERMMNARRYTIRRSKNLGFIPLNSPFERSAGHHIDKNHVIFIPIKLHLSIFHTLDNPESMKKINRIASYYLHTGIMPILK